jgi:glycosyltransferase involved in cell wall biosynthesis
VLLARALFPRTVIALDHLIFAANTAADRGTAPGLRTRLLGRLDDLAIAACDLVVVDTEEHRDMVAADRRPDAVVVPVGASGAWFDAAQQAAATARSAGGARLRVVFFGLFTPLQGAPTIGRALRLLHERSVPVSATLVGAGQDAAAVHREVDGLREVRWHEWVDGADLPHLVAEHDVSLGIFGTTEKAMRVVPNKVYQGAAAGTAVVTSDTQPQRRALGDAALLVPPGDPAALADALARLAGDAAELTRLRDAAARLARRSFTAEAVATPLVAALRQRKSGGKSTRRPAPAPVG